MLKTKLEKFIIKRVLFYWILLTIVTIFFLSDRWIIFAGLTMGAVFSSLRLSSMASAYNKFFSMGQKSSAVKGSIFFYIYNHIIVFIVLAVSLLFNLGFFAGMTAGILLVPLSIAVNSITEAIGLTHNHFE